MTNTEPTVLILTENTRWGGESAAGNMRNRCVFTSRDMGMDWPEAFTYAIVVGWDDDDPDPDEEESAMDVIAEKFGWDAEMIAFIRDAHERFELLPRTRITDTPGDPA